MSLAVPGRTYPTFPLCGPARLALRLTQQQFGDRCTLHRTFIGSVERGERNLSILNLRTMARALRVPLADLFAGLPKDERLG